MRCGQETSNAQLQVYYVARLQVYYGSLLQVNYVSCSQVYYAASLQVFYASWKRDVEIPQNGVTFSCERGQAFDDRSVSHSIRNRGNPEGVTKAGGAIDEAHALRPNRQETTTRCCRRLRGMVFGQARGAGKQSIIRSTAKPSAVLPARIDIDESSGVEGQGLLTLYHTRNPTAKNRLYINSLTVRSADVSP